MSRIAAPTRDKLIATGLFLSKFGEEGLRVLGFDSFAECFNAIGYGLGAKPASIKNYRDEFDPLFPNARKGWHQRPLREHCKVVLQKFGDLDIKTFAALVRSFLSEASNIPEIEMPLSAPHEDTGFAKRIITGVAAERYFEATHQQIPQFTGMRLENTTQFGCGFDFRLTSSKGSNPLCVEVKGLSGESGGIAMTEKERKVGLRLRADYFLCMVLNFSKSPYHRLIQDPFFGDLEFKRQERKVIQVSWTAQV